MKLLVAALPGWDPSNHHDVISGAYRRLPDGLPEPAFQAVPHHCVTNLLRNREAEAASRLLVREHPQDQQLMGPGTPTGIYRCELRAGSEPLLSRER